MAAAGVFIEATRYARQKRIGESEERLFRAVNDLPDSIHVPVWIVMQFGSLASVGASALIARAVKGRSVARRLAISGFTMWTFCKAVKRLIGRGRPDLHLEEVKVRGRLQSGGGFPSGHTAVAVALATVAGSASSLETARLLRAAAAAVGLARIYVGAHLPLDVLGGAALGLATGAATELVGRAQAS
ncbi:MAG: phosphatase PAP2 family protein [Acidimicrobiia bacterium]